MNNLNPFSELKIPQFIAWTNEQKTEKSLPVILCYVDLVLGFIFILSWKPSVPLSSLRPPSWLLFLMEGSLSGQTPGLQWEGEEATFIVIL